jgi:hypothetical protein
MAGLMRAQYLLPAKYKQQLACAPVFWQPDTQTNIKLVKRLTPDNFF